MPEFEVPPKLLGMMADFESRMRCRKIVGKKRIRQNAYLRSHAIAIGEVAPGVEYWITESPMKAENERMRADEESGKLPAGFCESMTLTMAMGEALNGYVAFPKRRPPLRARKAGEGILDYIPVHGGVTYAVKDATACVYGFDTMHCNSDSMPRTELPWMAWQCRVLYEGILLAAKLERAYERAQSNDAAARILQPLVDLVPEGELGFGALIRMLGGRL